MSPRPTARRRPPGPGRTAVEQRHRCMTQRAPSRGDKSGISVPESHQQVMSQAGATRRLERIMMTLMSHSPISPGSQGIRPDNSTYMSHPKACLPGPGRRNENKTCKHSTSYGNWRKLAQHFSRTRSGAHASWHSMDLQQARPHRISSILSTNTSTCLQHSILHPFTHFNTHSARGSGPEPR